MVKVFTAEEISRHSSIDDIWIILDGGVYDVTNWLNDHPGGLEVLMDLAGKDATKDFNEVGHSDDAMAIRRSLLVGRLEGAPDPEKGKGRTQSDAVPYYGRPQEEKDSGNDSGAWMIGTAVAALTIAAGVYFVLSGRRKKKL